MLASRNVRRTQKNNRLIENRISRLSYNRNGPGDGIAIDISHQLIKIVLTSGSHIHEVNGDIILKSTGLKLLTARNDFLSSNFNYIKLFK